eukprot:GHRR01029316.1.p2 GENE.GHRR01029316.1~~GHRR01029316.1.p2  ORF type:complete len:102 (-),score=12.07 GHRR01029316.1:364-669(-)
MKSRCTACGCDWQALGSTVPWDETGCVPFHHAMLLQVVQKVEYPLWIVYVTQAIMFGGGLLGITYGILSTSWDPKREGTALGFTEFQANLPILLKRNKAEQ